MNNNIKEEEGNTFKNVFYVCTCTRLKVKGNETFRNMVKNKASKQKGREK